MKKTANPQKNRKKMTRIMVGLTGLLFLVFIFRFSMIMITKKVNGENLSEHVNNLYTRSSILAAKRGTIYDIGGNPIALDATSYSLVAVLTDEWSEDTENPNHIVDKEKTAEVLAQYISMSEGEILTILNQADLKQVEFGSAGTNLNYATKSSIEAENLPGITFEETPSRLYPNGIFASHLVGFAQSSASEEEADANEEKKLVGMMGIESLYDDDLDGSDGEVTYQEDSNGYLIPGTQIQEKEPVEGDNLYLTLDSRLQIYLESLMSQVYAEANPESMTAMLVDPETGAILAASQRPTFNATTKEGIDAQWQNLLVEDTYEPGSTFKILTLAAAVNEGVFSPFATYTSGSVEVEGGTIRDYNKDGWGKITYLEGLAHSSNVAFVKLVQAMGYDVWESYIKAFGIGQSTDSGLENEATGNYNYTYPLEKANTAFGQGVTVTPFQLMQAFTSIANEGTMMKLNYLDRTEDPNTGEVTAIEPEEVGSPITAETAQTVLTYLKEVVYNENGSGQAYQIEGTEIAAKTGTAEVVNSTTGGYYTGYSNYLYSVVGFAPADDPSYILYLTMKRPANLDSLNGSKYLSEIFNPFMTRAIEYDNLNTEITGDVNQASMPEVTNLSKDEALAALTAVGYNDTAIIGSGSRIVQQYPYAGTQTITNQKTILMTEGAMTMPDVYGWSKDDVLKVAEIAGINFTFEGEGYVVFQSLETGSILNAATEVQIILE